MSYGWETLQLEIQVSGFQLEPGLVAPVRALMRHPVWQERVATERIYAKQQRTVKYAPHTNSVIDLIRYFGCKEVAEIGVWTGDTAIAVLAERAEELDSYWMVDPWGIVSDQLTAQYFSHHPTIDFEKMTAGVQDAVVQYHSARVLQLSSEQAALHFAPESLDMVFIDSDHSYDCARRDIAAWLPIVRDDGIICGHDYCLGGVYRAVNEVFPIETLHLLPDSVWFVEKGRVSAHE